MQTQVMQLQSMTASEEEQSLSKDESSEAISGKYPVSYNDYKISFKEVYEIQSAKASSIQIPITTYSPWNSYNFILIAFYDNYDTAFSSAQIYGTLQLQTYMIRKLWTTQFYQLPELQ